MGGMLIIKTEIEEQNRCFERRGRTPSTPTSNSHTPKIKVVVRDDDHPAWSDFGMFIFL